MWSKPEHETCSGNGKEHKAGVTLRRRTTRTNPKTATGEKTTPKKNHEHARGFHANHNYDGRGAGPICAPSLTVAAEAVAVDQLFVLQHAVAGRASGLRSFLVLVLVLDTPVAEP